MAAAPSTAGAGDGPGKAMEQTTFRRILNTGLTGHDPRQAEQGYVLFSPMNDLNQTLIIDMAHGRSDAVEKKLCTDHLDIGVLRRLPGQMLARADTNFDP